MKNNTLIARITKSKEGVIITDKLSGKGSYEVIKGIKIKKDSLMANEIVRKIKENTRR